MLDLSKPSSASFLCSKIDAGHVLFIPMAPPCGTASRARDKPIPVWLRKRGVPSPPPLRSEEHPCGLPSLRGQNLVRVELASACYQTAANVFSHAHAKQVFAFIENPKNSYMWKVPRVAALFELEGVYFTCFHACMHSGKRDEQTALLHNCRELCQLAVRCDGRHKREQWGVSKSLSGGWKFDTSAEAEYPLVFCQRVAVVISKLAQQKGFSCIQIEPRATPLAAQASSYWRVAGGKQPHGRRAVPMLPEDGQQVEIQVSDPLDMHVLSSWQGRSHRDVQLAGRIFPAGTRLLHHFPSEIGEKLPGTGRGEKLPRSESQ